MCSELYYMKMRIRDNYNKREMERKRRTNYIAGNFPDIAAYKERSDFR